RVYVRCVEFRLLLLGKDRGNYQDDEERSLLHTAPFTWDTIYRPPMKSTPLRVPPDAPSYSTILHALDDVARRVPDRPALICEGRRVTFSEHLRAVSGFARRLQRIGVQGERVAILMTNCLEFPIAILGAMAAH